MRTVLVKPERCIGCRHCEVACAIEHSESRNLFEAIKEDPVSKPRIHVEVAENYLTFPNRCIHCDPAPCMQVCPTEALYRDDETGSVIVNYSKCIRCGVCAFACPFGVIEFRNVYQVDIGREVNAKCDNCIDRQKKGMIPACAEACKTGALEFGDVNILIRKSRRNFTVKLIKSRDTEVELPEIPENIAAFRMIMGELADL